MKLTRREILEAYKTLEGIRPHIRSALGSFSCAALRRRLEDEAKPMEEALKEPEAMAAFHIARVALCRQMAEKDAGGEPKTIPAANGQPEQFDLGSNRAAFMLALQALRVDHKPALDEAEARLKEGDRLLREEVELPDDLAKMKLSAFKDDVPAGMVDALFKFIIDDTVPA